MLGLYLSLAPLVDWRAAARPLDFPGLFGRGGPVELEIGCGNGERLVQRAQERPEANLIGLEKDWPSLKRALRRVAQAGVENVRLLLADARVVLDRLVAPETLSRVDSFFPCPWPKRRHAERRLFGRDFNRLLNSRLKAQGEVGLVTDSRPFAEWVATEADGCGFKMTLEALPPLYQTRYGRKWRAQGAAQFWKLGLVKREHQAVPLRQDEELQSYRVPRFDPETFSPPGARGDPAISFHELVFDPKRDKALLRVTAIEDGFPQGFWIEVVRQGETWAVRAAAGSRIIPTRGVQLALTLVRDHILQGSKGRQV